MLAPTPLGENHIDHAAHAAAHPRARHKANARELLLLGALALSIPAFYMLLDLREQWQRGGQILYVVVAVLVALAVWLDYAHSGRFGRFAHVGHVGRAAHPGHAGHAGRAGSDARAGALPRQLSWVDTLIAVGALASALPLPWPVVEWMLRLIFCGVVFLRIATLLARYVAPNRLLQIVVLAMLLLALAGEGFVLLEPKVHSYADGLWMAFVTAATLGYGDLVPSNMASRIFAGFIVFLGYAFFSVVTASISALLVGEDEQRVRKELHADLRLLRKEIAELRQELRDGRSGVAR